MRIVSFKVFRYLTVSRRPHRCFLAALKVILSLSDRQKIFTSDCLSIKVCQNAGFSKIDITMTTIKKNFQIDFPNFARSTPATENRTPGTKVWCLANNLHEK